MGAFVLVHGAWHGGWCWEAVRRRIEDAGHVALAPDLPGHGDDPLPAQAATFDAYVARVGEVLARLAEPAVLVGHSMGGAVITQAGEAFPERIRALAYLAAYIPSSGQSVLSLARSDADSRIGPAMIFSDDRRTVTLRAELIGPILYGDCPEEQVREAIGRLTPQATQPLAAHVGTTEARWGRLPRVYLECLRDRAVTVDLQRRMQATHPCGRVIALDSAHSPFLSQPEALARHLLSI